MPVSTTPPGANSYLYVCVCICLYHIYCIYIYMHACMYICMYVYGVCIPGPFACNNNTIFEHICMKPLWLSRRYRLIWFGRQVFEPQLSQGHFILASISFCFQNLPPVTFRRSRFLLTLNRHQDMHTSTYM
jgi:hypothetical protein